MIFKIADGRECFYQWDLDRQLIVSDPTITEVHFCNRTDVCSLVVEVVDGVANVPNKLLQSGFDVRVFGYDGKATMHEATFKVKARTQPADYVYTETVVKSIEEILEAAETVTTTANEFYEFVEDHTLGFTDDGEGNVELIAVDAEEKVDLTGYYTKPEVDELIENIDIPETDLTGYATEEYVDAAVKNVEVDESKFASKDHSHTYSSLTGKPVIPSIEGLASEEYVDEAVKNAKPDLTGYATEKYVDDAIANIELPEGGESVDLSNYYTKDETYSKTEVDDLISNIEIPEGGGGSGGAGTPVYNHHINIGYGCKSTDSDNANNSVNLIITNDSDVPFTKATLKEFLSANNYILKSSNDYADYYPATGGLIIDRHEMSSMSATEVTPTEVIGIGLSNNFIRAVTNSGNGATHSIHTLDRDAIASSSTNYYECFHDKVLSAENIVITGSGGSSGESVDLSNYYTKEETTQAIQDALNAIGVAEGGAY